MYGSPDPLGVVPQTATPSGYVSSNPVLWVDPHVLKACPNYLGLISEMIGEVYYVRNFDEKSTGNF